MKLTLKKTTLLTKLRAAQSHAHTQHRRSYDETVRTYEKSLVRKTKYAADALKALQTKGEFDQPEEWNRYDPLNISRPEPYKELTETEYDGAITLLEAVSETEIELDTHRDKLGFGAILVKALHL